MLFKGGTSLSKAYGLIQRFSEDIDLTIFRDDLDQSATIEELEALSGKKRQAKLDAIRDACQAYVTGPLHEELAQLVAEATSGAGRVEVDKGDPDGQSLLIWYPELEPRDASYVQPAVRIESGAKSALDPHQPVSIKPYIAGDLPNLDLEVPDVTTIEARRTFWDKIVILHGQRRWFEIRGELKGGGHRISRHYYDLHQLMQAAVGKEAVTDADLGQDCVEHARMFFNRAPFDLASAQPPTFRLVPEDKRMFDRLAHDYEAMSAMIFGEPPTFDEIVQSTAIHPAGSQRELAVAAGSRSGFRSRSLRPSRPDNHPRGPPTSRCGGIRERAVVSRHGRLIARSGARPGAQRRGPSGPRQ